jgi:hypothetical protein
VKMWLRQEDPQFYRDGLITRTWTLSEVCELQKWFRWEVIV